ncbi:ATP binding protein [Tritrichomonas foetus]|uniref:GPN-loop GTPase 3 n=1 Tax=Tritrichomonas foetus TaxID=1144522 RepID=A0A1J4K2K0_9EUKA|nr:ATP binding protein [Tritrichomonas foetus]|eukprot:OHT03972.1 ATP binding protein [Tritrichomonas foetus]
MNCEVKCLKSLKFPHSFMSSARFAQIVMGPAGSGKSSYIQRMIEHFEVSKRNVRSINLDPAAESLCYVPSVNITDALDVREIMEKYGEGPNGALIHCMETIVDDFEWFDEVIGENDNDYLLIDLPGQIELFSHLNILPRLFSNLLRKRYHLCTVFLLDSQFMCDSAKFLSGCLVAISAMTMMETPHINLLSKCDLLSEDQRATLEEFCNMDITMLGENLNEKSGKIDILTTRICELIQQYNLVSFIPFDPTNEEMVTQAAGQIDMVLNYYEDGEFEETNSIQNLEENE